MANGSPPCPHCAAGVPRIEAGGKFVHKFSVFAGDVASGPFYEPCTGPTRQQQRRIPKLRRDGSSRECTCLRRALDGGYLDLEPNHKCGTDEREADRRATEPAKCQNCGEAPIEHNMRTGECPSWTEHPAPASPEHQHKVRIGAEWRHASGGDESTPATAVQPPVTTVAIEVHQHDFIPGWAAYRDDGEFNPESKAHVVLNIGSLMACVEAKDAKAEDLPYMIAETIMHEVIHVLEAWAKVEFNEDRIEALLAKYREQYGRAISAAEGHEPKAAPSTPGDSRAARKD